MDYKAVISDKLGRSLAERRHYAIAIADQIRPGWLDSGDERYVADLIMQKLLTEDQFGRMLTSTNEELTDWIIEWFLLPK